MCLFDGHIRELGLIEPQLFERLKKEAADIPETVWENETGARPNNFSMFQSTQHIIFQFPCDIKRSHLKSTYKPIWDDFQNTISPIIKEATKWYKYQNGKTARIMLARLLPKSVIEPHIDAQKSADVPHKIHVPIFTNPKVEFFEDDKPYYLEAGQAYEVNNKIPHGVSNQSDLKRIHLIFDYYDAPQ